MLLVVDDDEANRDMLSRRLEHMGYAVTVAESGRQAIDLVRTRPFDLVLLDVMMSGLSGLEVLRQLRQAYAATELPVIMATAPDRQRGRRPGAAYGRQRLCLQAAGLPRRAGPDPAQLSLKHAVEAVRPAGTEPGRAERRAGAGQRAGWRRRTDGCSATCGRRRASRRRSSPAASPTCPARFAWHYRPCEELAGDGLNVFALDDRHAALYVFDVSGHGVASSLLSVSLSRVLSPPSDPASMLRPDDGDGARWGSAAGGRPMPPVEVAGELNRMFPFDEATEQYFTMIYGVLDVGSGAFRYVSAGHPGVVHLAAAGGGGSSRTGDTRSA